MPANSGDARLVPPIRNSPKWLPSGNACVRPMSMPVVGSASMATSGTARPGGALAGTTPFWYAGRLNNVEKPPPAPYRNPESAHVLLLVSDHLLTPQPVWNARLPLASMAVDVPPTDVTN